MTEGADIVCASPEVAGHWTSGRLHPELVAAVQEYALFSRERGLPSVVITSLIRPPAVKFSWHARGTAGDFRVKHYTQEQLALVLVWFEHRFKRPAFECLRHDVGQGDHLHLGRRDRGFEMPEAPNQGGSDGD